MLARFAFVLAAVAASVSAQLQVISPGGPDLWWVASSENNIVWTCQTSPVDNFTILISNSNPSILVSPIAVIAVQQNFDCSRTLTTQQVNFTTGTGYRVILANPINSTDVYAQSDEFEIKPVGSAYPATSATPTAGGSSTAGASGSATASGSEATSSDSGALAQRVPFNPSAALGGLLAGALGMLAL